MPRLHKYRGRDACNVLTAIRGAVVTYQLTPGGERKLAAAGIGPGQLFPRAWLLGLCLTGDAYTGGTGVDDPAMATVGQIELDFPKDPDPETAFPACDVCRSVHNLHLTLTGSVEDLVAQLQCATCRALPGNRPDTSIPVALLSRPLLSRLFQSKPVKIKAPNVKQFEQLLQAEFESKWVALCQRNSESQASLFDTGPADGLNLSHNPVLVPSGPKPGGSPAQPSPGPAMKFTVNRQAFIAKLQIIRRKRPGEQRVRECRLSASGGLVRLEIENITVALEARIDAEGACTFEVDPFTQVLKTYTAREEMTFSCDGKVVSFGSTAFPVTDFTQQVPPSGDSFGPSAASPA